MKKRLVKSRAEDAERCFTGRPHIELYGSSACVVDGLESVLEYSDGKICLAAGKKQVIFRGSDLHIDSFTPLGAVVEGLIVSLEFSDAD